jgi:hypothetical protein
MPSTNPEPDYRTEAELWDLFAVANLALWAGDYPGAEERLTGVVRQTRRATRGVTHFQHPVGASAATALRQLRRRRTEFGELASAGGLTPTQIAPTPALRSSGGHLSAVLWAESDWEYELRAYVNDLDWEREFYKSGAERSLDPEARSNVARLEYGNTDAADRSSQIVRTTGTTSALSIRWVVSTPTLSLQVEFSDFSTCTVRGVWTSPLPPQTTDEVVAVFQGLLDELDPGT